MAKCQQSISPPVIIIITQSTHRTTAAERNIAPVRRPHRRHQTRKQRTLAKSVTFYTIGELAAFGRIWQEKVCANSAK